jgi:hypothetical protein
VSEIISQTGWNAPDYQGKVHKIKVKVHREAPPMPALSPDPGTPPSRPADMAPSWQTQAESSPDKPYWMEPGLEGGGYFPQIGTERPLTMPPRMSSRRGFSKCWKMVISEKIYRKRMPGREFRRKLRL